MERESKIKTDWEKECERERERVRKTLNIKHLYKVCVRAGNSE